MINPFGIPEINFHGETVQILGMFRGHGNVFCSKDGMFSAVINFEPSSTSHFLDEDVHTLEVASPSLEKLRISIVKHLSWMRAIESFEADNAWKDWREIEGVTFE